MNKLMYQLNRKSDIRPYTLRDCPEVINLTGDADENMHEAWIIELLAYYRGEKVTEWVVRATRNALLCDNDLPMPIHSSQKLTFVCTDGRYTPMVEVATLARHYELIANLYELDPDVSEIELPFSMDDVKAATSFEVSSPPIELIDFLMPKRTETYLWFDWPTITMSEERARAIGRGLEKETKMHLSRFASIFPDDELYPILEWATLTHNQAILYSLLEKKAPSALLLCLIHDERDTCDDDTFANFIRTHTFEDEVTVIAPREMKWGLRMRRVIDGINEVCWLALEKTKDPSEFRRLLSLFGIRCEVLGNMQKVATPFSLHPELPDKNVTESVLDMLVKIDPIFTIEMCVATIKQLYPVQATWSGLSRAIMRE